MHVLRTEDPVRGEVLPAMDIAAIVHSEAAVVAHAHRTHLAMNAYLLPLKPRSLPRGPHFGFRFRCGAAG